MYHIPRLSEAVYVGLCREVGSLTEVRIRREVMDTFEVVTRPVNIMEGLERIRSGSKREGFRMRTSDEDFMIWQPNHKIICDLSQVNINCIPLDTLILVECGDLPPGFTRLILMSPSNNDVIISSCVVMNNNVYISSKLFRDKHLSFLKTGNLSLSSAFIHGPCSSCSILLADADFVFCFQSHHWPTPALPWIQRCHQQGWPDQNVVSDILNSGFHVVPIGSIPESELQWRISFSRAEQKIIYSMNHCQFLCYGLFKIFLKEVINIQTNTTIICSYFIKTIIFWVIQTNTSLSWTPDNLLSCFWESFKLLIYMVHTGNCPNFFIPHNNMFRHRVIGSTQTLLFSQLFDLYCKGIPCLLFSETLRPYLSFAILNRTQRVCTDESSNQSIIKFDMSLFQELSVFIQKIKSIKEFAVYMKQIEGIISRGLKPYQTVALQCFTSNVLRNTAICVQNSIFSNANRNKVIYQAYKVCGLLKLSSKFGCLSDILYLAMYLYRTCRYEDSLSCLHKAQERMALPYIMYWDPRNVDMYKHYMEKNTLCARMRKAVVSDIALHFVYTYIDELVLEQQISKKNGIPSLKIPPLVMLHMLYILNHHRLGDTVRAQQSLSDLQTHLLYDDVFFVPRHFRDISWQILGICQQILGNFSESLHCYKKSIQQLPIQSIQEATLLRMTTLPPEMI